MADKTSVTTFTALGFEGPYKSGLVTVTAGKTVGVADTIVLDDHEYAVNTIVSASAHTALTGVVMTYAYSGDTLTKSLTGDTADVIRILYS